MKHRNNHFAVGYWSRLRRGRSIPDQADIDPRALKRLLPFIFLLDSDASGDFSYRLAGTTLCERFGMELRGQKFLAHWDADSRERLAVLLRQSRATNTPLCISSIAATNDCRMVELETVLMPISFGGKSAERFIAVAQLLTDASPIHGRPLTFERLVSASLVREGHFERNDDQALPPSPPPPPPPTITRHDGRSHPKAPHLRLVVSQNVESKGTDMLTADVEAALDGLSALFAPGAAFRSSPVRSR